MFQIASREKKTETPRKAPFIVVKTLYKLFAGFLMVLVRYPSFETNPDLISIEHNFNKYCFIFGTPGFLASIDLLGLESHAPRIETKKSPSSQAGSRAGSRSGAGQ